MRMRYFSTRCVRIVIPLAAKTNLNQSTASFLNHKLFVGNQFSFNYFKIRIISKMHNELNQEMIS